jgi:hypothetical protein
MMAQRRDENGRFAKAGSGRPIETKAAPAASSEDFVTELRASWARRGRATIETLRRDRPQDYLRLVASHLGKSAEEKSDPIDAMTDKEIADELRSILEQLAAAGTDLRP